MGADEDVREVVRHGMEWNVKATDVARATGLAPRRVWEWLAGRRRLPPEELERVLVFTVKARCEQKAALKIVTRNAQGVAVRLSLPWDTVRGWRDGQRIPHTHTHNVLTLCSDLPRFQKRKREAAEQERIARKAVRARWGEMGPWCREVLLFISENPDRAYLYAIAQVKNRQKSGVTAALRKLQGLGFAERVGRVPAAFPNIPARKMWGVTEAGRRVLVHPSGTGISHSCNISLALPPKTLQNPKTCEAQGKDVDALV